MLWQLEVMLFQLEKTLYQKKKTLYQRERMLCRQKEMLFQQEKTLFQLEETLFRPTGRRFPTNPPKYVKPKTSDEPNHQNGEPSWLQSRDQRDAPPVPRQVIQERADSLRREALVACGEAQSALCETRLDEAKNLDPKGDSDPRVAAARRAIDGALHPEARPEGRFGEPPEAGRMSGDARHRRDQPTPGARTTRRDRPAQMSSSPPQCAAPVPPPGAADASRLRHRGRSRGVNR